MASLPPKKNAAYVFYVGLFDQSNTKVLKANPTLASGDAKVSIDGGSFANLTTLPTVTPASGAAVKVTLSSSEMNGDNIVVTLIDAAGAEWCDCLVNIQTVARQVDDLAYPATSGRPILVDSSGNVGVQTGIKRGQTISNFQFQMVDATTDQPMTGLTVTATRCIDNGAFGSGTLGSVTEIGSGFYRLDIPSADMNGSVISLRFQATGAKTNSVTILTEP